MTTGDLSVERVLLKPAEAAKALGISPRKLWSLTAAGDIRHARINRSVRYRPMDLDEFAKQRLQGGEK